MTDKRRYGVIEVRRLNAETYHLTIGGVMWSEVEWSASRQAWCIQDAAGHCLTHTKSIVGQDPDVQTAIRLAKRMIVSGEMPTPEEAHLRTSNLSDVEAQCFSSHPTQSPHSRRVAARTEAQKGSSS